MIKPFSDHEVVVLQGGMQQELFESFLTKLEGNCESVLVGLEKDYRRVIASMHSVKVSLHFSQPLFMYIHDESP